MSLMNALTITLIVLILGAGLALFLGTRSSQANSFAVPLDLPNRALVEMSAAPDTRDARAEIRSVLDF